MIPSADSMVASHEPHEYAWVRRWCVYLGRDEYEIASRQARAAEQQAPLDAYSYIGGGQWLTIHDIRSEHMLLTLARIHPNCEREVAGLVEALAQEREERGR